MSSLCSPEIPIAHPRGLDMEMSSLTSKSGPCSTYINTVLWLVSCNGIQLNNSYAITTWKLITLSEIIFFFFQMYQFAWKVNNIGFITVHGLNESHIAPDLKVNNISHCKHLIFLYVYIIYITNVLYSEIVNVHVDDIQQLSNWGSWQWVDTQTSLAVSWLQL